MASSAEYDYNCPVCCKIFKAPVILSCSHSVCKECLQQFWRTKKTQECPVCRRRSSKENSPYNLALQNLCESFLKKRNESRSSGSEEICSLHSEKLKLFCLEDEQPACLVCRDSKQHDNHKFRPISEVILSYKVELNTALISVQEKLKMREEMKGEFEKTVQHIKSQAEHTEHQIKQQFEKLHQFLRDEEEATITALRKEEEQKKQMMKEKLEEMNRHISALSHTIKDTEEMMKANDVCFLKEFPVTMERVQISQPDPQTPSGALIHVPHYLGNLPFRVWKKMQDIVQNTPVILDSNTTHPYLVLSDDLTSVRYSENEQLLPDNPERFDRYFCVLGSEGFNSGTHCWDVEFKESRVWSLGVTTASNQRKGNDFYDTDVWSVQYGLSDKFGFPVKMKSERVRVDLDYDRGTVSFSDPVTNTHLHTFTTTFTDTVFPFFSSDRLRILPFNIGEKMLDACITPTVKHEGGTVMVWGCFRAGKVCDMLFLLVSALLVVASPSNKTMTPYLERKQFIVNRHISALSHTIKDTEEMMKANDVCFIKEFPVTMERVQISQPDPQTPSGALIHVPRYLGNLSFRVWKKMQDIVQNTPVILDPNTANPHLVLSDDLTSVRDSRTYQPLPDNPDRFDCYECVLGSDSFNCWDVEVKESRVWSLGVTTASNQRKGGVFFNTDVWSVQYGYSDQFVFPVKQKLERVRVDLDYDRGTVSFSDPVTNTHLHTFTTTFTDTVFPFFCTVYSLRILPFNSQ
ncbi:E3 ubiquitin-protein ligase TRIM35-like [Labeo rohita]|nr:E3 ubiquitin-protein ligase TRIM35-like [Labeo rohita]